MTICKKKTIGLLGMLTAIGILGVASISCARTVAEADYSLVVPQPVSITLGQGPGCTLSSVDDTDKITIEIDTTITNPEGYRLRVDRNGVKISGGSEAGVFYAKNTLRKAMGPEYGKGSIELPAVEIVDEPRFSYRGMHLDVCRHYFPIEFVKRYIDIMALHNMNTLHWHISDDQGWRWESKKYPKLQEIGAYRDRTVKGLIGSGEFTEERHGGYYTQDQLREIVDYAASKHITVVPEVDMPGHMLAALAAYPEFGCTGGPYEVATDWGVFDDVLCIGNEDAMKFLEDIFGELIEIFPSEYIHVGGDECPRTRWAKCPKCQARIKAEGLKAGNGHTAEDMLQSYCTARLEKFLNSHGRQIIGWDEILYGEVAPGATVMSWRGKDGGIQAAQMGHDVIMTPNNYCYFDYHQTDNTENEPLGIGGFVPVEKVYSLDPVEGLTSEQAEHIIGVQANVWTEYISTPEHVEYMILPRMAALSEVQWEPANKEKNYEAFLPRALRMMEIYDSEGYNYAKHLYNIRSQVANDKANRAITVTLSTIDDAPIYYTLDGSEPNENSAQYDGNSLKLNETAQLRAVALRNGTRSQEVSLPVNFNLATLQPLEYVDSKPNPKYACEGLDVLVDGRRGLDGFASETWVGFNPPRMSAVIDLGEVAPVSNVMVGTIDCLNSWIMAAKDLQVSLSTDGKNYTNVNATSTRQLQRECTNGSTVYDLSINFPATEAKYVKVTVKGEDKLPKGHPGEGKIPFLFLDEIQIN